MQAQILWRSRRSLGKPRRAYLYDVRLALPKRTPTAAQLAAIGKALRAQRICARCERDAGYTLPRRIGACLNCATEWEIAS